MFQLKAVRHTIITAMPPMPPIAPAVSNAATKYVVDSKPYIICGS
jgi:hypothetical protein